MITALSLPSSRAVRAAGFVLFLLAPRAEAQQAPLVGELVFAVDTGTEMPFARLAGDKLEDGLHKDLGEAIARVLERTPRFLVLPRKRIGGALEKGKADLLCMYVPAWMPGPFDWSKPFFPHVEIVVTDKREAQPNSVRDLAYRRLGTILGYQHPELNAELRAGFVRDDGPSHDSNLRKLAAGRIAHAVTSTIALDYHIKLGNLPLVLHEPLAIKTIRAQCAVSRKGHVRVADVDWAVNQIVRDNTITAMLDRYKK